MELIKRKRQSSNHKYIWRNIQEHVLIVERTLGREIRRPIEIHHVDGNGRNNERTNLIVCPDSAYHALLHMRTKALNACGNPDWRKCSVCKKWDAIENMKGRTRKKEGSELFHRDCINARQRAWKAKNPEWIAKRNAMRREQYAADPQLRASIMAGNKRRYHEQRAKERASTGKQN